MEDIAKQEILEAIGVLADTVQDLSEKTDSIQVKVGLLMSEVGSMKAVMVTKSYLDDKVEAKDVLSFRPFP